MKQVKDVNWTELVLVDLFDYLFTDLSEDVIFN